MDRHLVTVEVGVECCANEWVQLDGLAFDQGRFKSLNTKTVQRWRTVKHNRMLTDDILEDVPNHRLLTFNHLLGLLDGRGIAKHFQLVEDEGLK